MCANPQFRKYGAGCSRRSARISDVSVLPGVVLSKSAAGVAGVTSRRGSNAESGEGLCYTFGLAAVQGARP